jgi:hypothetical protein
MRLWSQHARKGTKIDPSEFSKLLRIYLYLRVHVDVAPAQVKSKYAQLRSEACSWYRDEVGDAGDCESLFARAVEVSSRF